MKITHKLLVYCGDFVMLFALLKFIVFPTELTTKDISLFAVIGTCLSTICFLHITNDPDNNITIKE